MTLNHIDNGIADQGDPNASRSLPQGELLAYFQPKVDLRDARAVGVEAVARWAHPNLGPVPLQQALGAVEAGGHIRELTERLIEYSTRAAGDWWRSGLGLQLAVNLPEGALSEADWDLLGLVDKALSASGLPAKALQFEVTEDALLVEPDRATDVLGQLSKLGTTIAIDDFGTGHFSLRQLMRLPIDELKIDRSFIVGLSDHDEDRRIVRSTIHLAHQMGLQVVAEGVDTEDVWRQLRSLGCERAQGNLIANPLPAREIPAWLATWNHHARELSSTKQGRRGVPTVSKSAQSRAKTAA
jgi:EAL domain-containing protein (putative c-di-GMP-specific phosphodiesterase class I)